MPLYYTSRQPGSERGELQSLRLDVSATRLLGGLNTILHVHMYPIHTVMNRNIYIFSSTTCRLFKWGVLGPNSPNGALPAYRFWFMDPTCPLRYNFILSCPVRIKSSQENPSEEKKISKKISLSWVQWQDDQHWIHVEQ